MFWGLTLCWFSKGGTALPSNELKSRNKKTFCHDVCLIVKKINNFWLSFVIKELNPITLDDFEQYSYDNVRYINSIQNDFCALFFSSEAKARRLWLFLASLQISKSVVDIF